MPPSAKSAALVRIRTDADRLAVVERASAELARAESATDAKRIADMAKAAEVYGKMQGASKAAIDAAHAIMVDAMAVMGEFLKKADKQHGARGKPGPGRGRKNGIPKENSVSSAPPTYAEAGIPAKQAMHAQALATVKENNPELYEKVRSGQAKIASAHVEVKRQEKREELVVKAKAAPRAAQAATEWKIVRGEVGKGESCPLQDVECDSVRLVFADPPYNIGFDYGEGYDDRQAHTAYLSWVKVWVDQCADLLAPDGSMWVLINDEYAAEYNLLLKAAGLSIRNWLIWYESFGVNCSDKFNRTKRHLFYCVRDPERFVFHFDAVSRPSDRQTKYADARANPSGKVLDDVWFDIPRLVGNADERMPDFPTQLPLALLRRVVACASDPGDLVLDPFCGSGTTGAASIELDRRFLGVERSAQFHRLATLRLKGVQCG